MADAAITPTTETTTEAAPAVVEAAPAAAAAASLDDGTILGGDAKPVEPEPVAVEGAPEAYALTLPEGVVMDDAALALAEPVFRDLNLTNDQASKLAAIYPQIAQASADRASQQVITEVIAQRAAWATESQNLPDIGGANFDASKVHAARFIDGFGGAALRTVLNDTGLGNHPALFAAFVKAGRELAEDNAVTESTAVDTKPKTLGERYYGASA